MELVYEGRSTDQGRISHMGMKVHVLYGKPTDPAEERIEILPVDVFHREKELPLDFA